MDPQIVSSRSLPRGINYTFMCLSAYGLANKLGRIPAVIVKHTFDHEEFLLEGLITGSNL